MPSRKPLLRRLALVAMLGVLSQSAASAAPSALVAPTTEARPPAPCSSPGQGPAEPPAGAVRVDPGVDGDLYEKTMSQPAGTTFWLAPGTHTLGRDPFGQVIPKDGDTYLGAPGAVLDGRGVNYSAFTQQAKDVTIRYLTVRGFVAPMNQGVVNHDSGDGWLIADNVITNNRGAAMMAGARQQILRNCLKDNGQYGINAYKFGDSITGLVVEGNEITGNNTDDWESKIYGCGCTGGAKFWHVNGADIRGNWVHENHGPGLWADMNDNDFLIEGNWIERNAGEAVFYEASYNLILRRNIIRGNAIVSGKAFAARGDNFPIGAVYISESGGEPRIAARTDSIEIYGNRFDRNWAGITAWENADRFCNSPANPSGNCTRLVTDASACQQPAIAQEPLRSDCRWKTQRLDIHDNTFVHDPGAIGCTGQTCGRSALLSNYGSYPDWSPYLGTGVQDAITFHQGNRWHHNTYAGQWRFVAQDTSNVLGVAAWTSAPYGQDADSTFVRTGSEVPPPTPTVTPAPTATPEPVPTPTPAPVSGNVLDADSAGFEGGLGAWTPWYSAGTTRTPDGPHTGAGALRIEALEGYGWGVQAANYPGFRAGDGDYDVSFWARSEGPAAGIARLAVEWIDEAGTTLATTALPSPALTDAWQQASVRVAVPAGARTAFLTLTGAASRGQVVDVDDIDISRA